MKKKESNTQKKVTKKKTKGKVKKVSEKVKKAKKVPEKGKKIKKVKEVEENPVKKVPEKVKEVEEKPVKKAKPKKEHYVDSKRFAQLILESHESEVISHELADCILKISTRLSFRPNFINYSYKDEMVGDAILKMLQAVHRKKFQPEKGNAFSYFTRIAFNAFCNRIKKEKKEKDFVLNLQDTIYDDMMGQNNKHDDDNSDEIYLYENN